MGSENSLPFRDSNPHSSIVQPAASRREANTFADKTFENQLNGLQIPFFHASVQRPVACAFDVTVRTACATIFMHYPLLESVLLIATCFGSVETSSGNYNYLTRIKKCFWGVKCGRHV
jgi:hypothetical protein